jgi:hypothetical protein
MSAQLQFGCSAASSRDTVEPEAVSMSDGAMVVSGLLALLSVIGVAGVVYRRLRHAPAVPFHWSTAEHQHALIMSRYYANFGPPE